MRRSDDWTERSSRQPLLKDAHSVNSYVDSDPTRPQFSRRHRSDSSRQPSDLDVFLGIGDEARETKPRLLSDDGGRSGAAAAAAAAAAGIERSTPGSLNDGAGAGTAETENKSDGSVRRRNAVLFIIVLIVNILAPLILKVSADIYTERYAFYNLQMSSFAYDLVVLSVLLHKMYFTDEITPTHLFNLVLNDQVALLFKSHLCASKNVLLTAQKASQSATNTPRGRDV